ncbi:Glycerophosphodiester phosphodiesterase [Escherichia coli]|nr:Glycerophosphodiester phosphodiesterase [Escherichia coli]
MLIEETSQPGNIKLTGMVQDAQQNKLAVHPYTVRSDKLPEYTTDVNQLYDALYNKAGVNGLFTDFPDKAVKFLNKE